MAMQFEVYKKGEGPSAIAWDQSSDIFQYAVFGPTLAARVFAYGAVVGLFTTKDHADICADAFNRELSFLKNHPGEEPVLPKNNSKSYLLLITNREHIDSKVMESESDKLDINHHAYVTPQRAFSEGWILLSKKMVGRADGPVFEWWLAR